MKHPCDYALNNQNFWSNSDRGIKDFRILILPKAIPNTQKTTGFVQEQGDDECNCFRKSKKQCKSMEVRTNNQSNGACNLRTVLRSQF